MSLGTVVEVLNMLHIFTTTQAQHYSNPSTGDDDDFIGMAANRLD